MVKRLVHSSLRIGLSCTKLFKSLFKKETGQNLSKYIKQYRMEKAKELLTGTNMKIVNISEQVGYPNVSYFVQSFREYIWCKSSEIQRSGRIELKKIKQRINDIRLQNKLVIIYVVTGLIPLIVLFVFAYCQMRNILMDRDLKSIKGALEQSVATVDGQIEVYDNLSNYITFNDTLSGVLSYDYKSTYEMYNQIVTTFDPMLSSLKYFHNDINRVTIYVR